MSRRFSTVSQWSELPPAPKHHPQRSLRAYRHRYLPKVILKPTKLSMFPLSGKPNPQHCTDAAVQEHYDEGVWLSTSHNSVSFPPRTHCFPIVVHIFPTITVKRRHETVWIKTCIVYYFIFIFLCHFGIWCKRNTAWHSVWNRRPSVNTLTCSCSLGSSILTIHLIKMFCRCNAEEVTISVFQCLSLDNWAIRFKFSTLLVSR